MLRHKRYQSWDYIKDDFQLRDTDALMRERITDFVDLS
jgi:hypothetical protein